MFKYDKNASIKAKKLFNKNNILRNIYHSDFAPSNNIGECINLCEKLKPISHEDFERKYHEYAENNKILSVKERGLTKNELYELVKKYKEKSEKIDNTLSFIEKDYYDALICHIITETYDGYIRENNIYTYFNNVKHFNIVKSNYKDDSKKSIDFIIEDKENKKFYIQIKPLSFFKAINRPDTFKDNQKLVKNYLNLKEKENIDLYLCIYVSDGYKTEWLKNKNGGICHKIEKIYKNIENIENLEINLLPDKKIEI